MIDSIVSELNADQYKLLEDNKFYGKRATGGKGYFVHSVDCSEYATRQHKNSRYFPMIRIPKKKSGIKDEEESLEMQISLPKAVHGTSIFEVDESDLEKIETKQLAYFEESGICTSITEIQQAIIRRADFAKVIRLPSYLGTANQVILSPLSSFDYKPQSDCTLREYYSGSGGVAIKFWNNTQGYVIYDKIGEIISNGYTEIEKKFAERVKSGEQKRNALKFELSLQRKTSFEAVVWRKLNNGKKKNFVLREILNKNLAKSILLDTFDKVFSSEALGLITLSQMEENILLNYLESKGITQSEQEKLFYWVRMATMYGIKGTWDLINVKCKGGSVGRMKGDISRILVELGQIGGNTPNLIDFLRAEHERFEIIKP